MRSRPTPDHTPADRILPLAADGFILSARSTRHHWSGSGKLSLKTFSGGPVYYELGKQRYAVDEQSYFILNADQAYTIQLESPFPITSFCIFFPDHLLAGVAHSHRSPADHLLDSPATVAPITEFAIRTHPHDAIFSPALAHFRRDLPAHADDALWLDEQLQQLAVRMLRVQANLRADVQHVSAVRSSTREELYRRVHLAREFIAASFTAPLTLAEIAGAVYLSPNHLLRTFKQVFHQSPHQYLIDCRLRHARRLLTHTDLPITEVCAAVGFASLGSFSWLFRKRFGIAPLHFRQQSGDFGEAMHTDLVDN